MRQVNNPEDYQFRPKEMLKEISETLIYFAPSSDFQAAVARSGFYTAAPEVLPRAASTLRKHRMLGPDHLDKLDALVDAAKAAAASAASEESLGEAPEHFLDALLFNLMKDPVSLPSGHVVERATIEQHLLNDPTDPFSRQPLTLDQLKPADDLRAEIEAWKAARAGSKSSAAASEGMPSRSMAD